MFTLNVQDVVNHYIKNKMSWDKKKTTNSITESNNPELFVSIKEAEKKRGLKILCYGSFSTGKTHFGLNTPGPVYAVDTENGMGPLSNKFEDVKVVVVGDKTNNDSNKAEQAEVENFVKVEQSINYLIDPNNGLEIGTVVIDSLTDVWSYTQAYMKVKKFKIDIVDRPKQQWDWGVINATFQSIVTRLINQNFNLILNARANEVYAAAGQPSGQYVPACQKNTPYWADIVLYFEKKIVGGKLVRTAKITKCRKNGDLEGKVVENPTFEKIQKMIDGK